jgi:hypothetical protein
MCGVSECGFETLTLRKPWPTRGYPGDEWKYHPKHVEQFPDIHKLCNVASCSIYIGILLGAHHILHISRIRVNQCKERITIFCTVFVVWFFSIEANWNVIFSGQHHLTTAVTENPDASVGVVMLTLKKASKFLINSRLTVLSCLFTGLFVTGRVCCYRSAVCVFIGTNINAIIQQITQHVTFPKFIPPKLTFQKISSFQHA